MYENIKTIVPDISKEELREDMNNLAKLYSPSSEKIKKNPENLRGYSFLPNEETSQKEKKIKVIRGMQDVKLLNIKDIILFIFSLQNFII